MIQAYNLAPMFIQNNKQMKVPFANLGSVRSFYITVAIATWHMLSHLAFLCLTFHFAALSFLLLLMEIQEKKK